MDRCIHVVHQGNWVHLTTLLLLANRRPRQLISQAASYSASFPVVLRFLLLSASMKEHDLHNNSGSIEILNARLHPDDSIAGLPTSPPVWPKVLTPSTSPPASSLDFAQQLAQGSTNGPPQAEGCNGKTLIRELNCVEELQSE